MSIFQEQYKPFHNQELRPYHESVAVQIHITNVLLKHYFNAFTGLNDRVKLMICDRYIHAVPVFIEALRQMGFISDFSHTILLNHAKDNLLRVLPQADFVYYLEPPLSTIERRIATTGREGECGFLTREYLEILHREYPKHVLTGALTWKRNHCAESEDILLGDFITFINNNMAEMKETLFTPLGRQMQGNCGDDDDEATTPSIQRKGGSSNAMCISTSTMEEVSIEDSGREMHGNCGEDDDDTISPPIHMKGAASNTMLASTSAIEDVATDDGCNITDGIRELSSTTTSRSGPLWWVADTLNDDGSDEDEEEHRDIKKKKLEKTVDSHSPRPLSSLAARVMKRNRVMTQPGSSGISSSTSRPQKRIVPTRIYPRMIQYIKLHPDAQEPLRGTEGAAGYDLTTLQDELLLPNQCIYVRTGIALNLPANCYGRILDRSSVALTHKLITIGGVIDEDYTGEIKICLINLKKKVQHIPRGVRIAQIVFQRYVKIDVFQEVKRFDKKSERGVAGFGSTGGGN